VKIVFCSYFRQKWIDLRQFKTKMIGGLFYTAEMLHGVSTRCSGHLAVYLLVIIIINMITRS